MVIRTMLLPSNNMLLPATSLDALPPKWLSLVSFQLLRGCFHECDECTSHSTATNARSNVVVLGGGCQAPPAAAVVLAAKRRV